MKRFENATETAHEHYTLSPEEIAALPDRSPQGRLGFALLLKYLAAEGRFPSSPNEIPRPAVRYVASQINVAPEYLRDYAWQGRTIERHRAQIRKILGFREATVADGEELGKWLREHLNRHDETHPENAAHEWLRKLRIEPPTSERMQRIVCSAVHAHEQRLCFTVQSRLPRETCRKLDALLATSEVAGESGAGSWERSDLAEILKDPGRVGLESVLTEVAKLERVRQVGFPAKLFDGVAPRVPQRYRRRAAVQPPRELRRHPEPLRYTLLVATCWVRGREIIDNLVDLLIHVVHRIGARAERKVVKELLGDVIRVRGKDGILLRLAEAAVAKPDGMVREVIFPVVGEESLRHLVRELKSAGPAYRLQVQSRIRSSYGHHYRRMLPKIAAALEFRSNNKAPQPIIEALGLLERYADSRAHHYRAKEQVPIDGVVPDAWRDIVIQTKNGRQRIHRIGYEICVLQALRNCLRTKEIWVVGADRYRNPDEDLPADFAQKREAYYEALGQPLEAEVFISGLQNAMDKALKTFDERLAKALTGTQIGGKRAHFKVSRLKAQKQPPKSASSEGKDRPPLAHDELARHPQGS